jgi:hypothetical protein
VFDELVDPLIVAEIPKRASNALAIFIARYRLEGQGVGGGVTSIIMFRPCEKAHAEAAAYPDAADTAPSDSVLTAYDEEHAITYLRLLD